MRRSEGVEGGEGRGLAMRAPPSLLRTGALGASAGSASSKLGGSEHLSHAHFLSSLTGEGKMKYS